MTQRLVIQDFSGGMNTGQGPSELQPNESTVLRNFYPYANKLVRRGGIRRIHTFAGRFEPAGTENLTGFFAYRPDAGATMLVGTATRLARYDVSGMGFTLIPTTGATPIGTGTLPWIFFQYKDVAYLFRTGSSALFRTQGSTYATAGIVAPVAGPTIVDGAAGRIPAANFYVVYTYYNSNTGVESNPSMPSAVLAHGANLKIDWSFVAASTNPQVTSRRLYRTLPNQTGTYYFIGEIANNITTTFTGDDVLVQELGDPASYNNGLPPASIVYGDVWRDRFWCTDGTDLFVSEVGLVECFADEDSGGVIRVLPDDGHKIRGIRAWGDRVVIGKTGATYYITGTDPDNFSVQTLSDRHGVASHYSMKVAEGSIFWLGPDDVYRSDGGPAYGIGNPKIRTYLDDLRANNPGSIESVTAGVLPEKHQYRLSLPNVMLVYDYKTHAWSEESATIAHTPILADFISDQYEHLLYGVSLHNIYEIGDPEYGFDDPPEQETPQAIPGYIETRELDFGNQAGRHVVRRLHVLAPQYAAQFSAKFITDRATAQPALRTGMSLDWSSPWKAYAVSSMRQSMSGSRLAFVYTGEAAIEVEGFAFDYDTMMRFLQPR